VTAVTTETRPAQPVCGDRADDLQSCQRPLGHDGPHRHAKRGEWLNYDGTVRVCGDKGATPHGVGRCTRDPGHDGAHTDYKRGLYWQAES
jgi:hypothetical protein